MNKELQEMIAQFERLESATTRTVLATVVDVKGSSYRLPGARMLVGETGEIIGTVSGGCLEADVLERARRVLETGAAEVFTYDTTAQENSVFSLNMGCRGVIRILLEPINDKSTILNSWKIAFEERERQFIATLISAGVSADIPIGGKIFYSEVEQFDFENLPKLLESSSDLLRDCEIFFDENGKAQTKEYEIEQGVFEFFFEIINPPISLVIFGAGFDALPLAELAKILGWRATIVDHRAAFASRERFPKADRIVITRPETARENLTVDENTAAVVMTHNYEHDRNILHFLLNSNARYVGALGPKRRTENILREWGEAGVNFTAAQLDKLHAPVGLDIGADTPEAIALSIVAEIKSVLANRAGGFLRERKGSIYNRNVAV